ncbi:MAG: enhanced serine sensitivity protein SseB C-terminal domain-containing protein, partial [Candidatus Acidiferrum sp.]
VITRNEFLALAQGLLPESRIADNTTQMRVAPGQRLLIGAPAKEPPADVLEKLSDYFQQIPELRGAYLFQMTNQGVTSSVIGLQFLADPNAQRMEQIIGGIGQLGRGAIPTGMFIDFMPLKAGSLLDSVQKCGKALLKK